jgi:hypothetical protein
MRIRVFVFLALSALTARSASAQDPSPWMVMTDGALFAVVNHQGGPRGGDEFKSTNWWMAMAARRAGTGQLTLTLMVSLDPLTATARGYRELFQTGEAYKGQPLVDRQHPHDLLMQAAVVWRTPLTEATGLTIAAAPVGEPSLGPVAFMHRPSAIENPVAPLAHHTLDSTHIAMEVITAAIDRGPWTVETSLFHGAEPDDNRWDLMDPGALDSWSARAWFKPSAEWEFQISHGFLKQPEMLEPGDLRRTTASAAWLSRRNGDFTAVTLAFGRNDTDARAFHAFLAEATDRRGDLSVYGRFESVQKETGLLETGLVIDSRRNQPPSTVTAVTIGAVREISRWRRFEIGAGADVTLYAVPGALGPSYGDHPTSVHIFLRVRPSEGPLGRMWNMRMIRPM